MQIGEPRLLCGDACERHVQTTTQGHRDTASTQAILPSIELEYDKNANRRAQVAKWKHKGMADMRADMPALPCVAPRQCGHVNSVGLPGPTTGHAETKRVCKQARKQFTNVQPWDGEGM